MIALNVLFWIFVVMYAIIGASRGWAKEVLVSFSVILALFIISILTITAPVINNNPAVDPRAFFWVRAIILILIVFFGYQSAALGRFSASPRFSGGGAPNIILGALVGAINGYLIFGTLWHYLHISGYPFDGVFSPLSVGQPFYDATITWLGRLPPVWLTPPGIYFAIAVAFAFILIVLL
jgi:hypothetical protein